MSAVNNADIFRASLFINERTSVGRQQKGHGLIESDKLRFLHRCCILADYSMYGYTFNITLLGDFKNDL